MASPCASHCCTILAEESSGTEGTLLMSRYYLVFGRRPPILAILPTFVSAPQDNMGKKTRQNYCLLATIRPVSGLPMLPDPHGAKTGLTRSCTRTIRAGSPPDP